MVGGIRGRGDAGVGKNPGFSVSFQKKVVWKIRFSSVRLADSALAPYGCLCSVLSWLAGRNHSETWLGCIVSGTTATRCSLNCVSSTSLRRVALKAATVRAASYLQR